MQIFQKRDLVLINFILVLKILLKLILDTIYKSFKVAKIFTKKNLEFVLKNKYIRIHFKYILIFILYIANINAIFKKKICKQVAVIINDFDYIKMRFALLTKLIAI